MPQAIAGVSYVVAAIFYVGATIAINYGLGKLQQSLNGKRRSGVGGTPSREFTVKGTVEPMQLIYGQVKTAGFIAFVGTSGTDNKYLHFVVVWAAHQCEELSDHWLDSRTVLNAAINVGGDVTTSEFQDGSSRLLVRRFLGTNAQTADSELTSSFPSIWGSDHRGAGVCYTHFRLDRSEKAFPQGAPASFFALVKGRRLYDPRLDSTNGGSGSHRYDDATTWEWSQNASLARRDYITGGSRWYDETDPEPRLGFAAPNERIDDSYTITAADICDEDVFIPPAASPSNTQNRYTCDMQLSCADTHLENLRKLESCDVGHTTYVNGQYRIYAGAYDAPTITIEEDDILGPVVDVTHPNKEDLYNLVSPIFYDESRDWQLSPAPNITNTSYETADGGQRKRSIELPGTRTSYRAQRIGILHLAQSRHKETFRFERLSPKALSIAEHETFMVNCAEIGASNLVLRCLEWELLPDCFVAITARVETSNAYNDPAVGDYASPNSGTVTTPSYDLPVAPSNLTAAGIVKGVLLTWTAPTPVNSRQIYNIYQHTANTPFSSATKVWSGNSLHTVISLDAGVTRYFWVKSELNGVESSQVPAGNGVSGTPATAGTTDIGDNAATDPIASADNAAATAAIGGTIGTVNTDILTVAFTPTADGELKLTAQCNVTQSGAGGALGRIRARLVLDSTVLDEKLLIVASVGNGTALNVSLTAKADVTGGVAYTGKLQIQDFGTGTDPSPTVTASQRVIRAEVNLR